VTVALVIVWSTKIVTTTWSVLSEAIPAPGQLVRNRPELVLEALTDPSVGWHPPKAPGTGSLRTDLLAGLHGFARMLDQPRGQALRPLMTQRARHPELYAEVHRLLVQPRLELVLQILRAGVERGEVAPEAVTPRIAAVGAWLVIGEHMERVGSLSRMSKRASPRCCYPSCGHTATSGFPPKTTTVFLRHRLRKAQTTAWVWVPMSSLLLRSPRTAGTVGLANTTERTRR